MSTEWVSDGGNWADDAQARIEQTIRDCLPTGWWINHWVLVATANDGDGKPVIINNTDEGALVTDTLGLLTYALEVDKARAVSPEED